MNEDWNRHREIQELGESIQLERDAISKLKISDPLRNDHSARLNTLLRTRNNLKNS
ncbi:hypothetical protein [Emcibacter sp. SYSU 3D8]|uniref:hypothetical protein n=1 Tax=Emcibacter sp. SYSU 3D8 TaxID=3133969 RepID=UPI0031FE8E61